MNRTSVYCSRTHKFHFLSIFSLNMGPTALFTHLKIILLQCFQFSVFNFSKINSIQTLIILRLSCFHIHSRAFSRNMTFFFIFYFIFSFFYAMSYHVNLQQLSEPMNCRLWVYLDRTYFTETEN